GELEFSKLDEVRADDGEVIPEAAQIVIELVKVIGYFQKQRIGVLGIRIIQLEEIQPELDRIEAGQLQISLEFEEIVTELQRAQIALEVAGRELDELVGEVEERVVELVLHLIQLEESVPELDEVRSDRVDVVLDQRICEFDVGDVLVLAHLQRVGDQVEERIADLDEVSAQLDELVIDLVAEGFAFDIAEV